MRRFLLGAVLDLAAPPPGGVAVLSAPAPVVPIDRLLDGGAPALVWDAPAASPGERRLAIVGFGEALRVDADGEDRLDAIRHGAERVFSRLVEHTDPALDFAPP